MLEKMKNSIEVSEEKSIKNTSLFIRNININSESYETKILLEENIDNVMKFQIVYEGEQRALRFDVSNTVSFEEYLKVYKLKKQDLCDIIDSIDDMLSSIENYLIAESSVALDLKLIRLVKDKNNKINLKFIIIPNYKVDFSYELSKFLIRILRYVDIEDKNALSLAYGLFVKSSKDNYTINDLLELVDTVRDRRVMNRQYVDEEALTAYDEENALVMQEELQQEMISNSEYLDNVEMQNDMIDNVANVVNFNNLESRDIPIIDRNTRSILQDELLEKFDDEIENKVTKKKKILDFKPKKVLGGHISFEILKKLVIPFACVIIPITFCLLYGMEKLMKFAPFLCVYEIVLIVLFVINNIITASAKNRENNY